MDHDQALADYLAGIETLEQVALADPAALFRVPADGSWSAARIIHHLADADVVSAERLRRMLAEDNPTLRAFEPDAWAERLRPDHRDVGRSVALVRAVREANVSLLSGLDDADWHRVGTHEQRGPITVEHWVASQSQHLAEHVSQALEALAP